MVWYIYRVWYKKKKLSSFVYFTECLKITVIILNRGSIPRKRTGRKWCNSSSRSVQRHSVTSLDTVSSLANGPSSLVRRGGGAEGEVCILRSSGIAAFPISLLSMGGVSGRSLTAGKIIFTEKQTCPLYLVLSLCAKNTRKIKYFKKSYKIELKYHPATKFVPIAHSVSKILHHFNFKFKKVKTKFKNRNFKFKNSRPSSKTVTSSSKTSRPSSKTV